MFLIVPGMLFQDISNLTNYDVIILEEHMNGYSSHRQEYNKSCLREYEKYLKSKVKSVRYYQDVDKFYSTLINQMNRSEHATTDANSLDKSKDVNLHLDQSNGIYSYDPLDRNLYKKWSQYNVIMRQPLNFLLTREDIENNNFRRVTSCYNFVLRKIGHRPMKSLDKMNRSKLNYEPHESRYKFPITQHEAYLHLRSFLKSRLETFGANEDAIEPQWKYLSHSLLSTPINMGLLRPSDVVKELMKSTNVNESSYEGFLRQICGWREYMYFLFVKHMNEIIKCNSWNNKIRKIPQEWYDARTLHPIFNHELEKVLVDSYAHHIPRLMVFLCLLTLYGFHPESIIEWFNANISMDAYDWVMVTNVYCMGYFCKSFTSRHYLCSSQYIARMSHGYKRDKLWDEKYRDFVSR
jgi:deoxyribodipyrimidine photolyase-like uncharacterized protein